MEINNFFQEEIQGINLHAISSDSFLEVKENNKRTSFWEEDFAWKFSFDSSTFVFLNKE